MHCTLPSVHTDIFVPNFRMVRNVPGEHSNALLGVQVDDIDSILDQPIDAAAEIYGLADDYGADAELADEAAAIPARSQRRDHNLVAVTSLPARLSKRIRFTVRGRIAFLHSAVVAFSQQFSMAFE